MSLRKYMIPLLFSMLPTVLSRSNWCHPRSFECLQCLKRECTFCLFKWKGKCLKAEKTDQALSHSFFKKNFFLNYLPLCSLLQCEVYAQERKLSTYTIAAAILCIHKHPRWISKCKVFLPPISPHPCFPGRLPTHHTFLLKGQSILIFCREQSSALVIHCGCQWQHL